MTNQITFKENGQGPAILFIPGSFSTPAAWRDIQSALPQHYRMITTSLLGYGETAETRSLENFDMRHEIDVLAEVGKRIAEPIHLVGHSFGATVGLAATLGGVLDVLSLTTFEANPISLLREQGHLDLFTSVQRMSTEFEASYHAGEPQAASRIIDFWGGTGSFASMPEAVKDYCVATSFANVLDWRCVYTLEARKQDYEKLSIPALIVRSERANPAMVEITEELSAALPNAGTAIVGNSNHFLITSHSRECAALLVELLASVA